MALVALILNSSFHDYSNGGSGAILNRISDAGFPLYSADSGSDMVSQYVWPCTSLCQRILVQRTYRPGFMLIWHGADERCPACVDGCVASVLDI
jgi:hypothetical protein